MLIVTGTGRSGTGYMSRLLGIGHEETFNIDLITHPNGARKWGSDSSWMYPRFHSRGNYVAHVIRDPLLVISSISETVLNTRSPWTEYICALISEPWIDDRDWRVAAACRFHELWIQECDKVSDIWFRVEDVSPWHIIYLWEQVGRKVSWAEARALISDVPTGYNKREHRSVGENAYIAECRRKYGYT